MIEIENKELRKLFERAEFRFRDVILRKKVRPLYEEALLKAKKEDDDSLVLYIMGKIQLLEENYEIAQDMFKKARDTKPDFVEAWHYEGLSLYNLGLFEKAIYRYENAITIDENYAWSYNNKGLAFAKLEKYVEAIECYDKCINLDPTYAGAAAWYNK
jgi:tetratricopeptide (TPR) repeat protein